MDSAAATQDAAARQRAAKCLQRELAAADAVLRREAHAMAVEAAQQEQLHTADVTRRG